MENPQVVREKALRLGIRTGIAPDLDFVWQYQLHHGSETCFGSFHQSCPIDCRWFERCKVLSDEPLDYLLPIKRVATTTLDAPTGD